MSNPSNGQVLGVVLLVRHGDRQGVWYLISLIVIYDTHYHALGFYQDPTSYTPFGTAVTPLGTVGNTHKPFSTTDRSGILSQVEEQQLGSLLRQRYLTSSSPNFIQGIDPTVVNNDQIRARADAGGEGGVIFNSAVALLQGFFPPTLAANNTLANGTTITAPLGGYQVCIWCLSFFQDH